MAQKLAMRREIGAEDKLQAGIDIVIGAPNNDGVRQIGVRNPTAGGGGAPGAEDAYKQTEIDPLHDWKIKAIQYTEPHEINLTWKPGETPQTYEGSTKITPGTPGVSALLGYIPLSQSATNRGKFTLATEPLDTGRSLANLFSGRTVISLILKIGADLAAAKAAKPLIIPVEPDPGIGNTFAIVAKTKQRADPKGLAAPRADAVALIDFGFAPIFSEVPDKVVSAALVEQALQANPVIAGIATDGITLYLLDRQTRKVGAITLATMTVDTTKEIAGSEISRHLGWAGGIATDGTRLYVTGRTSKVLVFEAGEYRTQFKLQKHHATGIAYDGEHLLVGVDTFKHVGEQEKAEVKAYTTDGKPYTDTDKGVPSRVFTEDITPVFGQIVGLAWNSDDNVLYVMNRAGRIAAFREGAYDADSTPSGNFTGGGKYGGLAYRDGMLWAADIRGPVVPFRVTSRRSAYQPGYDFRTVDQPLLRRLAREENVKTLNESREQIEGWFAPAAQADNADEWPLNKLPFEKLTQAQYDAGVAAGTIADGNNRIYLIVG